MVTTDNSEDVIRCEDCMVGKFNRLKTRSRAKHKVVETLDRVHSDLCSLPTKSYQGSKYIMTFLDERTHYAFIYFLKSKDQAFSSFKHYVAFAKRDTNKKMKKIRTDNGGEYTSRKWDTFCLNAGITHSKGPRTPPCYTARPSGSTERCSTKSFRRFSTKAYQ